LIDNDFWSSRLQILEKKNSYLYKFIKAKALDDLEVQKVSTNSVFNCRCPIFWRLDCLLAAKEIHQGQKDNVI